VLTLLYGLGSWSFWVWVTRTVCRDDHWFTYIQPSTHIDNVIFGYYAIFKIYFWNWIWTCFIHFPGTTVGSYWPARWLKWPVLVRHHVKWPSRSKKWSICATRNVTGTWKRPKVNNLLFQNLINWWFLIFWLGFAEEEQKISANNAAIPYTYDNETGSSPKNQETCLEPSSSSDDEDFTPSAQLRVPKDMVTVGYCRFFGLLYIAYDFRYHWFFIVD